mmetsp:Transcript_45821/g.117725  ORF Transcript_45821/g.117725 Transcript_45821/m.117725 type:complete len:497 (+) Transcript_45821:119-1609(+)
MQAIPGVAEANPEHGGSRTLEFVGISMFSLLGPGSSQIKEIRQKTGADVRLRRKEDSVTVDITGTPEQVQQAAAMFEEIGTAAQATDTVTETLEFPSAASGAIIGAGGANIRMLKQQCKVEVVFEKQDPICLVHINGIAAQVQQAKTMLQNVVKNDTQTVAAAGTPPPAPSAPSAPSATTAPSLPSAPAQGDLSEMLEFEERDLASIVGPGGSAIKETRQQTGASIVARKINGMCEVQISGTEEQVQNAKARVQSLVDAGPQVPPASHQDAPWRDDHKQQTWAPDENDIEDEERLTVSSKDASKIIGKAGVSIKRIRYDSKAVVNVEEQSGHSTVCIRGSVEAVDRARTMISDILSSEQQSQDVEWEAEQYVKLAFEDSKRVVGKGGATKMSIEKETWAKVNIKLAEGEPTLVRITGGFDAVDQALAKVQAVVKWTHRPSNSGADNWSKDKADWAKDRNKYSSEKWKEAGDWLKDDWGGKSAKRKWSSEGWQDEAT